MKKIIYIIIAIIIIICVAYPNVNQDEYEKIEISQNETVEEEEETIKIHIAGAVVNPGIIEVTENARISDAIEKAGGLTNEADITNVNLAYQIKDAQKIYIPNIYGEKEAQIVISEAGEGVLGENKQESTTININNATQTELETLPGIGPSTALKIIKYRKEQGNFKEIEDIKQVEGIGEAKFESIKDYICVD